MNHTEKNMEENLNGPKNSDSYDREYTKLKEKYAEKLSSGSRIA